MTEIKYMDEGTRDLSIDALVTTIQKEAETVREQYPQAIARQWEASPAPRPRDDVGRSATGARPADPTAEIVLDARRLAVRQTVKDAEALLRETAVRLTRINERIREAVARFDGER